MRLIDPEPNCTITRAKLLEINNESIRLGLSRTMPNEWLIEIPLDAAIPIKGAWQHRSCQGQYNAGGNPDRPKAGPTLPLGCFVGAMGKYQGSAVDRLGLLKSGRVGSNPGHF